MLHRCIKSIAAQTWQDLEIVILDDASDPPIETGFLKSLVPATPIYCLRADKQLGLNAVRNRLIETATGDIFFIIDDDAYFQDANALEDVASVFSAEPELGIVATKILDYRSGSVRPLTPHSRRHIRKDASILDDSHLISYFLGGAHGMRRSVIEQCGPYDEVLMYGLDEIELAYRALEQGFKIKYLPDVVVHHEPPPAPPGTKKVSAWRLYYLTRNRILFAYKHLPFPYFLSYVPSWLSWYGYRAITNGLLKDYWKGIRDGFRSLKQIQRKPISEKTIVYLKANYGRLWR